MSTVEIYSATIATAPAADESVTVLIPDLDDGAFRHGACFGWAQRADARQPQRDDPCAVFELDGRWWVVAWQPRED